MSTFIIRSILPFKRQSYLNWLVVLLFLVFGLSTGNKLKAQAYNFNYLSIRDGLPQSQAFSITFDSDNYAWIGTQGGGLCRYDGRGYDYLTNVDSLISNRVYSTKEFDDHLWVGQKGGVTVFDLDGNFVRNYRLSDPSIVIRDIVLFEGTYLFASNKGVLELRNNQIVQVENNPAIKTVNANRFFLTSDNELWVCATTGLLSYDNVFGKLSKAKGLSSSYVECVVEFGGEWVIGTYEGGVNFYNRNKVYQKEGIEELNDKIILSMFVSGEHELWIGTMNNGVYLYNKKDGSLRNFNSSNGLSSNHVKTIASDHWNNIWLGTSGGGVSIFQNSPFIAYNRSSGLNGNYVFSVWNDSRNNLWLGTEGKGVMRINDTSKVLFDEEYGFYSEKVKCIFEDQSGDIWFGTEGKGVGLYSVHDQKDTVYSYYATNGLRGNWIKCFAQDPNSGRVYIGTSDGGVFYATKGKGAPDQVRFRALKVDGGDVPRNVPDLYWDSNRLWYVGDNGFGFVKKGKLYHFKEEGKSFRNVTAHGNSIWLGSKDNGVYHITLEADTISNKEWIKANSGQGLQSNNIYQLVRNEQHLWIGTEKGLDRLELDSVDQVLKAEHFGFEEGFEGVETNINAGHVDSNGELWFGTVDGLFVYKGREPSQAQRKPPVLKLIDFQIVFESIENTAFASYYDHGEMTKPLLLPYNQNHVNFRFKAIHFSYSNNIRYRWKLKGFDPNWIPASSNNMATYSNLPPGEYEFNVQASIDDNWTQDPLTIAFAIDQPYWDKLWFKTLYYGAAFLILVIIIALILFRQRRKSKALNEKLILEKTLIELEQKALRLQMNPHFIFNVLNSIHNLIILNDSDKARYALAKFSKLMRQVLENSREKFVSVDDEVETLQNYVQLERLTANLDIELVFEIDDELDTAEEILPPLMIQPFVENAIVHGLRGSDRPGIIKVGFKWLSENVLECYVEDNGIGRKKASEINAQKATYHKSMALKVAQERLANLNKDTSFIPFEIIDLANESKEAVGTKVILRLEV